TRKGPVRRTGPTEVAESPRRKPGAFFVEWAPGARRRASLLAHPVRSRSMRILLTLLFVFSLAASTFAQGQSPGAEPAEEPQFPVAVRWWGQGMVSIETWWNLTVVIDPYGGNIGYEVPD